MPKPAVECSVDGCVKQGRQRGWCHMHYQRWRQHGDVLYVAPPTPMECRVCGAQKHINASGKIYCKVCAARNDKKYAAANADKIREQKRVAHERDRERRLPLFRANYQANRELRNEQTRQWQREHPELVRRYKQKWSSTNLDRGREYAARRRSLYLAAICEHGPNCVSAAVFREVEQSECFYCGEPAVHADHYIPLTRGGLHCVDNIVPACQFCNLSKNNHLPDEWLASVMPA